MIEVEVNEPEFSLKNHNRKRVAFGIGVDSVPSNKAWAQSMDIKNTRLLSDF